MDNKINKRTVLLFLLIVVSVLLFFNTFQNSFFLWDDTTLILKNQYIRDLSSIPYLFSPHYWKNHPYIGQYRALRTVTFALDYYFWKTNPFGYHLTNICLHTLNVLLIYLLIMRLGVDNEKTEDRGNQTWCHTMLSIPFLGALFFASHPIHTESVSWIKNRSDILALLFMLLSLILYDAFLKKEGKKKSILFFAASLLCFLFALASKEMALSLPLVLLLYAGCFHRRDMIGRTVVSILLFFAAALSYLFFKFSFLGMIVSLQHTGSARAPAHALIVLSTLGHYLALLAFPVNLNAEHIITFPISFFEIPVVMSAAAITLLISVAIRQFKRTPLLSFAAAWVLLTLLPVSNIIFLKARPLAEQRLYIPSLGFCIMLAIGINRLTAHLPWVRSGGRSKAPAAVCALLLFTSYAAGTVRRNFDWRNPQLFWTKAVKASPESSRARRHLADAYYAAGKIDRAIACYQQSIEHNPYDADTYYNLGIVYNNIGDFDKAISAFTKADSLAPQADVCHNLGVSYEASGKTEKAIVSYKKALRINPNYAEAMIRLGTLYSDLGRNNEAIALLKKAIVVNPRYAMAYNNLGTIRFEQGNAQEALRLFKKAVRVDPAYAKAYNNLGVLYRAMNKVRKAEAAFKKATEADPDYAKAYAALALLYHALHNRPLVIRYADKAIEHGYEFNDDFLKTLKRYRTQYKND